MTGQEVWEVWKENPKKKFERSDCKTTVILVDNKPHFGNADAFMRIDYFLNHDWQLVKQPVTWQEAIQAWGTGKIVSVDVGGCKFKLTHDDTIFGLSERMINLGTWYVEDVE